MHLPNLPLVVLDTETTGFVPKVHHIIEFASTRIADGKTQEDFEQLISIPGQIPEQIVALTRIRNEDLNDKPRFEKVSDLIREKIGEDTIIVGQNVGFDIGMLKGEGIDLSDRPWIDTSMLASVVFPEFESYSLGYMSRVLDLDHTPVHRALGDVRATTQLLSACWERLLQLPRAEYEQLQSAMERAPEGYKRVFETLPEPQDTTERPSWLIPPAQKGQPVSKPEQSVAIPNPGTVQLIESPIDDTLAAQLCCQDTPSTGCRWIAVKNLHAFTRRFDIPESVRIIHPPLSCIDAQASAELLSQESFTASEATLAVKLQWYAPQFMHLCPLHGEEKNLWRGSLACTWQSPDYHEQFTDLPSTVLIDHRQMLGILADEDHPGHEALRSAEHVIIDDASMLEDTSTKAYGWYCSIDDMRAAAKQKEFVQFLDTLQLWVEKLRENQDTRYISPADLTSQESKGLRSLLGEILEGATGQAFRQLTQLQWILDPDELPGRIAWIEQRMDGSQALQSVPEYIGNSLQKELYDIVPTTLLIPPRCSDNLQEILPKDVPLSVVPVDRSVPVETMREFETPVWSILEQDDKKKTIVLASSKRIIESVFVQMGENLEAKGITLLCQGFSGGTGRMQAEFTAAEGTAIWVVTPWMFEGIEIPPDSIDRLVIEKIPFDHPAHTVLSRRSNHYRNPFNEYSLPRAIHRLYRLLRTFKMYCKSDAQIIVTDDRLKTKSYGKVLSEYLDILTYSDKEEDIESKSDSQKDASDEDQLSLFT